MSPNVPSFVGPLSITCQKEGAFEAPRFVPPPPLLLLSYSHSYSYSYSYLILILILILVLPPLSQRAPRLRFGRAEMGRWKNRSTFRISRLNLRLPRRYLAKSLARCGLTFRSVSKNDFTIQCREYPCGQWQGSEGRPYVHRSSHWKPGNCCRPPSIQRS